MRTAHGMQRGALFGFDAFLAFLIVCFMLYLMVVYMDVHANALVMRHGAAETERIAIGLADIIVRDSNAIGGIGCAYYNAELHRIEENVIDHALCRERDGVAVENLREMLGTVEKSGHCVAEISLVHKRDGNREPLLEGACAHGVANCAYVERFVVVLGDFGIGREKARLVVGVCDA